MALAIAIFSLVIGSAMTLLLDGKNATQATQQRANAARKAQSALDRALDEFREASSTVNPDPSGPQGSPSLQFQQPVSVVGSAVVWSGMLQLMWESDPADPLGGGDQDGDGLVDEGRLVLVRNVGALNERRIVLASNVPRLDPDELANNVDDNGNGVVDEGGFNIQRVGDVFTLRLVVSEPGPGGQRQIGRAEASIRLRN
jgi:hypothetical protein